MTPWLWMLVALGLSGLTTWALLKAVRWHLAVFARDLCSRLTTLSADVAVVSRQLEASRQATEAYREAVEAQPIQSVYPVEPLGAFLPTDQSAADLERQILDSEDRAIAASGVAPFSPRPSRRWPTPSAPGRSTRGARTSGRP